MRNRILLLLIFASLFSGAKAQENEKPVVKWYGYINYESIFDSYESVTTRDAELYLYPSRKGDNNANGQLEMLALQSRLGVNVKGPEVLGAQSSGKIEGDFFGTSEDFKNLFRIRHAFMKLKWDKASLLMGQYWHPMFGPEVFPRVVAFGAAAIYNPLNRAPQIRFDYNLTPGFRATFAALGHGYHFSKGPTIDNLGNSIDASDDQRDAAVPDMQVQLLAGKKKGFQVGVTAGYMMLEPRVETTEGLNDNTIGTYNFNAFAKYNTGRFTAQAKFSYGQNMSQYVMLGGYGRLLSDTAKINDFGYTPYKIFSVWGELAYKPNDNLQVGIFGGLTSNLGTEEKVDTDNIYTRGGKISQLLRVSPRITYTINHFRFGFEYIYNAADYGTGDPDEYGVYDETEQSVNHRIILAARYFF